MAATASSANQPVAARRHHDRVEHDAALPPAVEPAGDRRDDVRRAEHADLHRIDVEVGEDRVDLGGDEIRRHGVDGGDARACSARSAR